VPELVAYVPSPEYEPVIVCVPDALGVYVTEQLAELPPPGTSVQLVELKLPLPLEPKLTVPVGVDFVPVSVSVTVAVQVVATPIGTLAGLQLTLVLVERLFTVTVAVPELVACAPSPEYVAVIVCVPAALGV